MINNKTVKYFLISFILVINSAIVVNAQVSFVKHVIESNFNRPHMFFAVDLDQDGDTDLLCAGHGGGIVWWSNDGNGNFARHTVDNNFKDAWGVHAFDIDRDGDIDIVGACNGFNMVAWYKNDGHEGFTKYIIDDNFVGAESVFAADFDNDGDVDIVAAAVTDGYVVWYENRGRQNFAKHFIDTNFSRAHFVYGKDVNNDGKIDVLGAASSSRNIAWWQNKGSGSFVSHTISYSFGGAYSLYSTDIDGDGHPDIVAAAHSYNQIAWWKNSGSGGFSKHVVANDFHGCHFAYAADIDGDEDIDIVATAKDDNEIAWWENDGSESFTKHTIDDNFDGAMAVTAADFDGDGDTDIAGGALWGKDVVWWENVSSPIETISTPNTPTGPTTGFKGQNLDFVTGGAISNLGHSVEYQFDWGDGNLSSWGSSTRSHAYSDTGNFQIRARARCEVHTDKVSNWSNTLSITISPPPYVISGNISYYSNDLPVKDVLLSVTGDVFLTEMTDVNGNYNLEVERGKSFTVVPSKPTNEDIGEFSIITYDAALAARCAVDLDTLTELQQIAADVDKDGHVYTFDAALICRYAVGLELVPSSHVGEWVFVPDKRSYQNLSQDWNNQDYKAIIIGNVHGDWTTGGLGKPQMITQNYEFFPEVVKIKAHSKVTFSIVIDTEEPIISIDINLDYDDKVLEFDSIVPGDLMKGFKWAVNAIPGKFRMGLYRSNAVLGKGKLLDVVFQATSNEGAQGNVKLNYLLVNDKLVYGTTSQVVIEEMGSRIKKYGLKQNYPNPFNSSTTISYYLSEFSHVRLQIYDLLGRTVRELVNGNQPLGNHHIIWDGRDDNGNEVPSGEYICQILINNSSTNLKLIKLR